MSGPKRKPSMIVALRKETPETLDLDIYDDIGGGFFSDGVTAKDVLAKVDGARDAKTINVRINSGGGDVWQGWAIYNTLNSHNARKVVSIDGIAASMASAIAMTGDEIIMPSNAMMMIHNPRGSAFGEEQDLRNRADLLAKVRQNLAEAYAARTGQPIANVIKAMASTTWMTADEAKTLGYATKVTPAKKIAAFWDLGHSEQVPEAVRALQASAENHNDIDEAVRAELDRLSPGASGATSPKEKIMKFAALFAILGLSAEASEDSALAAVTALKGDADVGKKLRGLTGKDGDAAIGTVSAWKEQAEKVPALESAAIETKATADKGALTALIDKARTDKKLTKDGADKLQARVEAGFKAKDEMRASGKIRDLNDDEWTLGQAKAYVEALTPNATLAKGEQITPPKLEAKDGPQGEATQLFNGKAYEDYTPGEMAKVRADMGEETYASLRSDWERRGKPRKPAPSKSDAA